MEKFDVYLFQYSQGNKKENRFYAKKSETLNPKNLIKTINNLDVYEVEQKLLQSRSHFPKLKNTNTEDIADLVEEYILEKQGFIEIDGIKAIKKSYRRIIRDVFKIEIKKRHLWARSNIVNYIGNF